MSTQEGIGPPPRLSVPPRTAAPGRSPTAPTGKRPRAAALPKLYDDGDTTDPANDEDEYEPLDLHSDARTSR